MPRITRIHFAGLGHHDARFPALTLDLRDGDGRSADTVIWAENGNGKSSLLNLFFSTYRPNQRQFLGKQAEGKVRELGDYVRERDLGFVITEWDTTDDYAQVSLLGNGSRDLLLVGQTFSWKGLDRSNDLRRLFFTLRPNLAVNFEVLPVLGLGHSATSFETFRDWLDEQNRAYPKLEIRYTTNQSEWQEHLANNRLDPELFTYQLRMNESEGGINNLFNNLKCDRDFIRLFLQLGFDPSSANQVRENLEQFLPKLRNRPALELQLEFNEKLLVNLDLFLHELKVCEEAMQVASRTEDQAGKLLSALRSAQEGFVKDVEILSVRLKELEGEETRLTSARTVNTRRQSFYKGLKCRLEVDEAKAELDSTEERLVVAQKNKRLVETAIVLAELGTLHTEARELRHAIEREQDQAKPILEALQALGARLKFTLNAEAEGLKARTLRVEEEHKQLRADLASFHKTEKALAVEEANKQQQLVAIGKFFADREAQRERLRHDGWLETKEAAADALQRWRHISVASFEAQAKAHKDRDDALREKEQLSSDAARLAVELAEAESQKRSFQNTIKHAETEEERIATHDQMRAAVESSRADLNLPQSSERLAERAALLFRHVLRLNVEGAEDRRAQAYVDKHRLFPPHRDVEVIVEKLRTAGIVSATTAAHWLAYNVADPRAAAELLASDPARFSGVMIDAMRDAVQAGAELNGISTEHIPVMLSAIPIDVTPDSANSSPAGGEPRLASPTTRTLLPRHSGSFSFNAAQVEVQKLANQQSARNKDLEQLNADLTAARKLHDELINWLAEFGGPALRILRERLRGEEERLVRLSEQQQRHMQHQTELSNAIKKADAAIKQAAEAKNQADRAIGQLETFEENFERAYGTNRARQAELGARLKQIAVELPSLTEQRQAREAEEPPLYQRITDLRVSLADCDKELRLVRYASATPNAVAEPLDELRANYEYQSKQYEGTFLNTKAQGELSAKEQQIVHTEARLDREFNDCDRGIAGAKIAAGDLPGQRRVVEAALVTAQKESGAAELRLREARKQLAMLDGPSEQERPLQAEIIPRTSGDAAEELAKLVMQYDDLQERLDSNRAASENVTKTHGESSRRAETYANHIKRLEDQSPPEGLTGMDLPDGDHRVATMLDEKLASLQKSRKEYERERDKLRSLHGEIQQLTQEDRYAQATDLPARSFFAHMSLEELNGCASQKRVAVDEEIKTLRADLELMGEHRETLVLSLLNVSQQAIRLLHRAEKWSVMPVSMSGWEEEPFLRIRLHHPQGNQECVSRLRSLVDMLLAEGKIPGGVELVFHAVMALVGETGIDATILKPETQRRRVRYPVREMGGWSEGERITVAILLYCTLVKIRAQSRGSDTGQAQVSALLLDNPIGPCSKPEFLQMHRHIAGQLGVQLIYATGINDPAALSVFPNRIRLAKNRIVPETGELAVGLVGESDESVISDIRIFDGTEKEEN